MEMHTFTTMFKCKASDRLVFIRPGRVLPVSYKEDRGRPRRDLHELDALFGNTTWRRMFDTYMQYRAFACVVWRDPRKHMLVLTMNGLHDWFVFRNNKWIAENSIGWKKKDIPDVYEAYDALSE